MTKKTYLCIHGHFYQPPRENPWIEEIESQDTVGGGFHDWNERISSECYHPNALARILDARQNIETIVNNFEMMSFNVGPTLLSWLEKYDPRTYERIMEADKNSRQLHHGHGNAIAQVYNHIIMPLANRQDKVTQVKWGIRDFQIRFGRMPEALWLSETACNEETLEVLVEEGIKFIILAPSQAEKIKKLGEDPWTDVSRGGIDPTRAYRCFLENHSGKSIDIFFYDGPISKAVAFDDLLCDAKIFANRLEVGRDASRRRNELVHIATDGETYGHHKTFGDRVLAYLLKVEAPRRGFTIANYGEYLEMFPLEYEVKIKSGENGMGTSWSCPHGVLRWAGHCGCRGGGEGHWRQDWRKPLRETFDWLRDRSIEIFVQKGNLFFKDVWAVRNDYIDVILNRSEAVQRQFIQKHANRLLSDEEMVTCFKLLEMQRNCMLMYTSCGWFFTELSGEETVQVIKYATRALQLAEEVSGMKLSEEFLNRLSQAKSNIDYFKDGRGVFDYLVRPSIVTLEKVVCHFAISSFFHSQKEKLPIYCYELTNIDVRKETVEDLTLSYGHVKVKSTVTLEEIDAVYVLMQSELYDFYCYVQPFDKIRDYFQLGHDLFEEFMPGHRNKVGEIIYENFGKDFYSLKDLFKDEKRNILDWLSKDGMERFKDFYGELYSKYRRMIDVYRLSKIPLPEAFQFIVQCKLSDEFNQLATDKNLTNSEIWDKAFAIRALAKEVGLKLQRRPSEQFLGRRLNDDMRELFVRWDEERLKDSCEIVKVADHLGIDIDRRLAQENYLDIMDKIKTNAGYGSRISSQGILNFKELGQHLFINIEQFQNILKKFIVEKNGEGSHI